MILWGFHSGAAEDSALMEYDAVSLGSWNLFFQGKVGPWSSGVEMLPQDTGIQLLIDTVYTQKQNAQYHTDCI